MSSNAMQMTAAMESVHAVEGTELMVAELKLPNAGTIAPMPTYEEQMSSALPEAGTIAAVKSDEVDYLEMMMKIAPAMPGGPG